MLKNLRKDDPVHKNCLEAIMKLWSRGLGTTEIKMDFRYYKITKDPYSNNVLVSGTITDPVNWEFRITMEPEDIPGFMKVFFNISLLTLAIKNAYRYVSYLFKRKQFVDSSEVDIEEKVNMAYEQMMKRSRSSRSYMTNNASG
jgi:hypothetical protein